MLCLPPELEEAPAVLPVSLAEAKAHLRVDDADTQEDDLIEAMIAAATAHLDGYAGILGRALVTQRWRQFLSFWPAGRTLPLSLAPVASVISIVSRYSAGAETTLDPASWRLLAGASKPSVLLGLDLALPSLACEPDAVTITYDAGYGPAGSDVPAPIRSAILLMVGDLFRFRETVALGQLGTVPMSATTDRLLAPYRRFQI